MTSPALRNQFLPSVSCIHIYILSLSIYMDHKLSSLGQKVSCNPDRSRAYNMGECTKRVQALLLLLLLVCLAVHGQCKYGYGTSYFLVDCIIAITFSSFCFYYNSWILMVYSCVNDSTGRDIGVDKAPDHWCIKSHTIPICNPDKYRCYCCVGNWQCYKTMDECNAKCSVLPPSDSESSSSSSVLL
jgi:hypothetical protein